MDVVQGEIGKLGKYDVKFENGQLVIEGDAEMGASSIGVVVRVSAKQVLDAFGTLGTIEADIVKILEAALLPKA